MLPVALDCWKKEYNKFMDNPWDKLANKFDTHKPLQQLDRGAADNVYLTWPPILDQIKKHFASKRF